MWILTPGSASSAPPDAAEQGRLEQESLPSLAARRTVAVARVTAAKAYFDGRGEWERAFPELIDAPLDDPDQLRVYAERTRQGAQERAAERVGGPPTALSAADARRWSLALEAACLAEDEADAQLARFLAGLAAGVELAPGLGHASFARRIAQLEDDARLPDPPDDAAIPLAVAAADEADHLRAWRRAAWRHMTRPGDVSLDQLARTALDALPALDPASSSLDRVRVQGLQDRLIRVQPLLDPGDQQRAASFIAEADSVVYGGEASAGDTLSGTSPRSLEELGTAIERQEAETDAARAALTDALADPALSPGARAAAEAAVDRATHLLARLRAEEVEAALVSTTGVSPERGTADVEAAIKLADEARERASSAASRAEQEIRRATAELRETSAEEIGQEQARRAEAVRQIVEGRDALHAAQTELAAAVALASLDPDRQPRIDAAYLHLREIASSVRVTAEQRAQRVHELRALSDVSVGGGPGASSPVVAERDAAAGDLHRERAARVDVAVEEQDATVELLIAAKSARRQARNHASRSARLVGQRAFIPELAEELGETRLVAGARGRELVRDVRALPALALDLSALLAAVSGSLKVLVACGLWWAVRGAVPKRVGELLGRLQRARTTDADRWAWVAGALRDRLEPGNFTGLGPPLSAFVRGLVNLVGVGGLSMLMGDSVVGVRLALGILGAWVAWRTWPYLIDVLLAPHEAPRPAVRSVEPSTLLRAHRTLSLFLAWHLGTRVLDLLLFDLLAADRLTQLADALSLGVGALLVVLALWLWAPSIQAASAGAEPTAMSRWAAESPSAVSRVPRAAAGLLSLVGNFVWRSAGDLLATRTNLRWIGAAMARQRLHQKSEPPTPLDPATSRVVEALDHGAPPNLAPVVQAVSTAHASWAAAPGRGAVAVLGDRGSGLDCLPDEVRAIVTDVRVLRVPRRTTSEHELVAWLSEALGYPGLDATALERAIQADRGKAILLLDVHNLLLRRVGGFGALRALVDLLEVTSDAWFWVCAFPLPTWRYLKGTPGAVDLGVFRNVLRVGPASTGDLEGWLLPPLAAAGLRPSFDVLAAGLGDADDPRVAARARDAYFRLLEDISQGRPLVARRIWATSHRGAATSGVVEHVPPSLPASQRLTPLGDDDLFLLTALAIHGEVTVAELASVLNRPEGSVQAACRRLDALDVVAGDEATDRYDIDPLAHPQVLRVLRHRAFLESA